MKRQLIYYMVLAFSLWGVVVSAQAPKLVVGRVLDKAAFDSERKQIPFSSDIEIYVYAFNTVAEAEDVYREMQKDTVNFFHEGFYVIPDINGYYSTTLPENGALLVKVGIAKPVLERVNGRSEITTYVDMGHMLENVLVVAPRKVMDALPEVVDQFGNLIILNNAKVAVPKQYGKRNARMIVMPYVVNNSRKDTLCYRVPRVYDGEEFRLSQNRWTGFDQENNDPLEKYVIKDEVLDEKNRTYTWSDTVVLPNASDNFQVFAQVNFEDYLGTYHNQTIALSSRYPRKPLRFLEYNLSEYSLDPDKYEERAKRELRTGVEDVSLSFVIGKAELDPSNPENDKELKRLNAKLLDIINGESSKLKELHISSVSSPDGSYASNSALASRRLEYAKKLIFSMLPRESMKRVYTYTENASRVASWEEVAMLLEQDSLIQEAKAIRDVIAANVGRHDAQSRAIKKLPEYDKVIKEYLPKLRTMKCEYVAEVFRALTPDEIMYRYEKDPDYRSGKKQFELYEYWNLFKMVKDPAELEVLYKRAYDFSRELNAEKKPWILAANNLAVSYLKRDTIDLSLLEPFIDRATKSCNVERTKGRVTETVNVEEIVANQLVMYLKANDFRNASILAQILPDIPKYEELIAFTYCLGGYYKITPDLSQEEIQKRSRYFQIVQHSSPLNNVVMCLAMNTAAWTSKAAEEVKKLPLDDARTHYLKAIIYLRQGDAEYMNAQQSLLECFRLDKSFISVAEIDGEIGEDFFKETMEVYELNQEMLNGGASAGY